MSFPFVQPYFGLGNSLQTAQGAAGGGAVGGWVELARTTLGSAGDVIDVTSLPDKRYYMILKGEIAAGQIYGQGRFNGDTGNNYASRYEDNGGADGTQAPQDDMIHNINAHTNGYSWQVGYVANRSASEKLCIFECMSNGGAGAANAPNRRSAVNKWANTSNAINQYTSTNGGTGDFTSGSEVVVLGWDPADTHTTNFWEELASVTLGGDASEISSGTISAKKYLWVQVYFQSALTSNDVLVRFNNDIGSNYAHRHAINFGSDTTQTSGSSIKLIDRNAAADQGRYVNFFVINNSANEKLLIAHGLEEETSGAGNPPTPNECVAKWANTSSQITEIDCFTESGNIRSGAELRVWGSD